MKLLIAVKIPNGIMPASWLKSDGTYVVWSQATPTIAVGVIEVEAAFEVE